MTRRECKTCRWFQPDDAAGLGTCHLNPPAIYLDGHGDHVRFRFPRVSEDDWCSWHGLEPAPRPTLGTLHGSLDVEAELYECEACSAKPGAPDMCATCVRNRMLAGEQWKGPRKP